MNLKNLLYIVDRLKKFSATNVFINNKNETLSIYGLSKLGYVLFKCHSDNEEDYKLFYKAATLYKEMVVLDTEDIDIEDNDEVELTEDGLYINSSERLIDQDGENIIKALKKYMIKKNDILESYDLNTSDLEILGYVSKMNDNTRLSNLIYINENKSFAITHATVSVRKLDIDAKLILRKDIINFINKFGIEFKLSVSEESTKIFGKTDDFSITVGFTRNKGYKEFDTIMDNYLAFENEFNAGFLADITPIMEMCQRQNKDNAGLAALTQVIEAKRGEIILHTPNEKMEIDCIKEKIAKQSTAVYSSLELERTFSTFKIKNNKITFKISDKNSLKLVNKTGYTVILPIERTVEKKGK